MLQAQDSQCVLKLLHHIRSSTVPTTKDKYFTKVLKKKLAKKHFNPRQNTHLKRLEFILKTKYKKFLKIFGLNLKI